MSADDRIAILERHVHELELRLIKVETAARMADIRLTSVRSEISATFYLRFMEVTTLLVGLCAAVLMVRRNAAAGVLIAALSFVWWWTMSESNRKTFGLTSSDS
jgi:hypothetical protein